MRPEPGISGAFGVTAVGVDPPPADVSSFTDLALRLRTLSIAKWGFDQRIEMVGICPLLVELQKKLEKVARYHEPVLITGESGVGKESIAQSIYLLSDASQKPFVSVNCPQYQEGNLTVSELFGHAKGSFTGAIADRRGAFEEADGGVIFLDEIGDLQSSAQAMLLRALATGEFRPLGASRSRKVDVRVISATNRSLNRLVMTNEFRYDLFFRLARFHVTVPPLRERGDDWLLLTEHWLGRLRLKYGVRKRLSPASVRLLQGYNWPGNVRQLINLITTGYAMADGDTIEPSAFLALMDGDAASDPSSGHGSAGGNDELFDRITRGGEDFWGVVYESFMERDLNRAQVKALVRKGLARSEHNYRNLLELFKLPATDYQRFMDFLRHHNLKP
jgi:transcriptional regulator with GAF, ATPase, and Fis domain